MSSTEITSNDVLICPYCGHEDQWAYREMDEDEWVIYECGNCQKNFSARKIVQIIMKSDIYE